MEVGFNTFYIVFSIIGVVIPTSMLWPISLVAISAFSNQASELLINFLTTIYLPDLIYL